MYNVRYQRVYFTKFSFWCQVEGELERAEERAETGETKVTHVKLFVAKLKKKAPGCFVANLNKNKHTFCSIHPKGFILTS